MRVVTINGQPWFVAKDVCKTLNMVSRAGTTPWLVGLDSDEKQRLRRDLLPKLFLGSRAGSLNIVTESGLYKLIMRSDKPEARGFQNWVTREVLPTIRKTGSYSVSKEGTQPPASCGAETFFHSLYTDVNRSA
ncbi:BRO-N domain-containing protein [Pseudochrobactrum kiredjianiae]|uniref:BRO-N domain-containing protein n=1 Tax=Pseudochrobactrum kiredjianiae TaxID=386305 RepID=UPI0025A2B1D6|nr:BRO family protein [Pseudochrobactrum kiredjianiae]MDM7850425.1 BRO family protein [Pseudochrobactrum kiredjianiae]